MKNLRGDTQKPENNDDCRVLAPFVMTLFDGEADEIEARRARAHLLVCQTCANRWLDWNRSRDLLLHSAPVPAPPPQLLWRVLMACRLSKTPQRAPVAAPPSANLSAQILARTTRAVPNSAPRRTFAPLSFPALAAPALCVWMLILQRDVWLAPHAVAPDGENFDSLAIETAPRPGFSAAKLAVAKPASTRNGIITRRISISATARVTPVKARALGPRHAASSIVSPGSGVTPIAEPLATNQALRVIQASLSGSSETRWDSAASIEAAPVQRAAPIQRAAPRVFNAPPPAPHRAFRPLRATRVATLSSSSRAPRLEGARFASAPLALRPEISRAARLSAAEAPISSQNLRVALPSASAPQPARLLAEWDSDDARIEEARSVVDDFRAAVDPDENSAESDFNVEENTG